MNMLQSTIAGIPIWAWAIMLVGGIGVAFYLRRRSGSSGSTLGQNSAGQSVTTDPNIDPNTGIPYSIEEAINPGTGLPAYYGGPGIDQGTGTPANPANPTGTPTTPAGPATTPATVRGQGIGTTGPWDKTHIGVPFDTAPGTGQIGFIPWGTAVQLTGPAVQGPSIQGITQWYPLVYGGKPGYVSGYDVSVGSGVGPANPIKKLPDGANPAVGYAVGPSGQSTAYWPVAFDLPGRAGY